MQVTIDGRDLDVRVATSSTVFGEMCVLRLLDKTRALFKLSRARHARRHVRVVQRAHPVALRHGRVRRAHRLGQDDHPLRHARRGQRRRDQGHDDRGPGRVRHPVDQPDPDQRAGRRDVRDRAARRSSARTPTRSSSARSATSRPHASPCRPRSPATSSCRRCTRPTRASALHRFLDMGIEPFLLASSLLGVVGQRLVRRNCPHCVEAYTPTVEEIAFFERGGGERSKTPSSCAARAATSAAHTGYYERVGVYEVLARHRRGARTHRHAARRTPSIRARRRRAGHASAARASHPPRRGRRHHHRRGPPDRVRAVGDGTTMPRYQYVAVDAGGAQVKGAVRRPERSRAAPRPAAPEPRGAEASRASARSGNDRHHAADASRCRRSCTSRARWPRSCAAASRSWTGSTSSPRARTTSASGRSCSQINEEIRQGVPFADALADARGDPAAVLPRHHPHRRADRSPRHRRSSSSPATSSATSRPRASSSRR